MALTNAQKQARWRERHIRKRRNAQRIVNLLVRKDLSEEHLTDIAALLSGFLTRYGTRVLRRQLRRYSDPTPEDRTAIGERGLQHVRIAIGALDGEQEAWERDHPGAEYPEHECGLSDREATDLGRWRRQRGRKHTRNSTPPSG